MELPGSSGACSCCSPSANGLKKLGRSSVSEASSNGNGLVVTSMRPSDGRKTVKTMSMALTTGTRRKTNSKGCCCLACGPCVTALSVGHFFTGTEGGTTLKRSGISC